MKALINQNRFLKAIEYASEHHFSKPYSISPMVDRWFNQLSMVHLANGDIIHITGKEAIDYVDIILDGKVVDKKDLAIVFQFYSQRSEHEKERAVLVEKIKALQKKSELVSEKLEAEEKKLEDFDANKLKAKALYEKIVERGISSLNEERLEKKFGSKITHIVHRPNHGLTHSVRVSYLVTGIHAFKKEFNKHSSELDEDLELEKLQMMMLFSVVGRRDETGFHDTGDNVKGCETYENFRTTSGRDFLKYCRSHLNDLYKNNLEAMYRDAIIVELMGYSDIQDRIDRREDGPPQLFIDYIIEKEKQLGNDISREEALNLITKPQSFWNKSPKYTLSTFFPEGEVRTRADAQLRMMNDAHGIDLTRCYSLYPSKKGGSSAIGVIEDYVNLSGISESLNSVSIEKLESVFKILRCSFDTLQLTGQKSTFGLISQETFDSQKNNILAGIQDINKRFEFPMSPKRRRKLVEEIKKIRAEDNYDDNLEGDVTLDEKSNPTLEAYRKYLILQEIVKHVTAASKLHTDKRMFDFQNTQEGNPHKIDHYKNAIKLIHGLQSITPVKGVSKVELPVISAVTHDRLQNKVTVFFENQKQAELFKETYTTLFGAKPSSISLSSQEFSIEVNREYYKKLLDGKLVEFKQVTVPKVIHREESLVDSEGNITALNLIKNSQALVRLVSTTALSGETFPDYDYLLRAFEDPVHERYTPPIKENIHFPVIRTKYTDPRTNIIYERKVVTTAPTEVRFQEPITEPIKFEDKIADGWVVGKSGAPQNTIYTKKLAHTLLPSHGKIIPFSGYPEKKWNYFPIGVLSDVRQVDLKGERYIWSENMDTVTKFWIKDPSLIHKKFYDFLNAQLEKSGEPKRYAKTDVAVLDKSKLLKESTTSTELIHHLQSRKEKIFEVLNTKGYRPSDEVLQDFKMLIRQERSVYLARFKSNKKVQKEIKELYSAIEERINLEAARKSTKYSINLKRLIELQKKSTEAGGHNEILAGNTKAATQAFYATRDQLIDRLNLAFHAFEIKKKYQYDVPLLILSQDKQPYHYTEAMIKEDLKNAYALLRKGAFPYDKTKNIAYELDSKGNAVLDSNGKRIRKKDSGGDVYQEKNQVYQKELLVNFFKLALPLTNIEQLEKGQIGVEKLDGAKIDKAVDSIIEKMDVVGGVARESTRMKKIFSQANTAKKEEFFIRQVALGNLPLIQEMSHYRAFNISPSLLKKAIEVAEKNNHLAVKDFLIPSNPSLGEVDLAVGKESVTAKNKTVVTSNLKSELADLTKPFDSMNIEIRKQRISAIVKINQRNLSSLKLSDLQLLQKTTSDLLLNTSSNTESNIKELDQLIKLFDKHPKYIVSYARIMEASDKAVKLSSLLKAHELFGTTHTAKVMALIAKKSDSESKLDQLIDAYQCMLDRQRNVKSLEECRKHLSNALLLVEQRGWDDAINYLLLIEFKRKEIATLYLKDVDALSNQPRNQAILSKIEKLIQQIEANGMGPMDSQIEDYCQTMRQLVHGNQNDYIFLLSLFHDLTEVNKVVTSPEMQAIRHEITVLEYNATGFFGSRISQNKANAIKEAMSQIPLLERDDILKNDSPLCEKLQKVLFSNNLLLDKLNVGKLSMEATETAKKLSN
ncbi:coiled-coil protein [Legionella gratiana]|uniref:Coiled-coil protein n=1 Tax=Legionella gratiana TaxID=45066 RepID=A0A378JBP6_9GAMM|nr:SidE phosphodiesterase domain-containing protein [Legionella gratiana]KTD06413.1 coiled-coil protein [Legionella gratiana]STX45233.1 coiled-coil protein [Legionella gratiana]